MATSPGSPWTEPEPARPPSDTSRTGWYASTAAVLLLLAAPVVALQAGVNSGAPVPGWARAWNGFRLAADARGLLLGDPANPQAGLTLGPGAADLAREALSREPLASDATFVLALEQSPLTADYRAGTVARQGAALDRRSALLQLLLIADAAGREDFPALFIHADLLAAAHPDLARAVLTPLFDRLGDPAVVPLISAALRDAPRWAPAFRSEVPQTAPALRNYLALRRQAGWAEPWASDPLLIAGLADSGLYAEAFEAWRGIAGSGADRFGFAAEPRFAPIGWRLVEQGDRAARIGEGGAITLSVERGAGGELARRLLQLAPGRYRVETRIAADRADAPLWISLGCATPASTVDRRPLTPRVEFTVTDARCAAHWLIVGASALGSRYRVEATLSNWRFTKIG